MPTAAPCNAGLFGLLRAPFTSLGGGKPEHTIWVHVGEVVVDHEPAVLAVGVALFAPQARTVPDPAKPTGHVRRNSVAKS